MKSGGALDGMGNFFPSRFISPCHRQHSFVHPPQHKSLEIFMFFFLFFQFPLEWKSLEHYCNFFPLFSRSLDSSFAQNYKNSPQLSRVVSSLAFFSSSHTTVMSSPHRHDSHLHKVDGFSLSPAQRSSHLLREVVKVGWVENHCSREYK